MNSYSLIPFVCGAGASRPGCEQGPIYCLNHGLDIKLRALGHDVTWLVNPQSHWDGPYGRVAHEALPPRGAAERHDIVSWHCQTLAGNVTTSLRQGRRVITIGGDHSMAAGTIAGAAQAFGDDVDIGLVWVDAHADINTTARSISKALHGMPVAAVLGLDDALYSLGPVRQIIKPQNIVYAGLRDLDDAEYEIARNLGISIPMIDDLRQVGIDKWLQDAVTHLSGRCQHIVLSIDLDGFSTDYAPAVGTPVAGGFTPDEILPVLSGIVRAHGVDVIEIVEFNPTLDGAERTFDLIVKILSSLL